MLASVPGRPELDAACNTSAPPNSPCWQQRRHARRVYVPTPACAIGAQTHSRCPLHLCFDLSCLVGTRSGRRFEKYSEKANSLLSTNLRESVWFTLRGRRIHRNFSMTRWRGCSRSMGLSTNIFMPSRAHSESNSPFAALVLSAQKSQTLTNILAAGVWLKVFRAGRQ